MENKTHKTTAFDAFFAEGGNTPGNAVRLAIADHRAGAMTDWAFVDALREAERRLDSYADLLEALHELNFRAHIAAGLEIGSGKRLPGKLGDAMIAAGNAIAKAEGRAE